MSVPRLQEYGGLQQQAAQRPLTEQNMLANQSVKHAEEQRFQSTAVEQSSNSGVKADQDGSGGESRQSGRGKHQGNDETSKEAAEPPHPYKGHRFDIKL
jgi:hypothetical protein